VNTSFFVIFVAYSPTNMPNRRLNRRRSRRPRQSTNGMRGRTQYQGAVADTPMYPPMVVPPLRRTRIQMRGFLTGTTNGSGVLAGYIPFDPSVNSSSAFNSTTPFNEWTSLANLYGEVRLIQFEVQMCRIFADETKGDIWNALYYATSAQNAAVPGTIQVVVDNGDCQMWSVLADQTGSNRYISSRTDRKIPFALTSQPTPSGGVVGGCSGSFICFGNNLPASSNLIMCKVVGTYEFRNRT
jgi:hypothetical protein